MEEFISRLKQIKKDELDEREFYEQVLSVIKDMEEVLLTYDDYTALKDTLSEIGCERFKDWADGKLKRGEEVKDGPIGAGIENADIETAVSFVSQLLGDYTNATFSLSKMLDGGEQYGWIQTWLRNSKELNPKAKEEVAGEIENFVTKLRDIKKDELSEREFYEKVLTVISGMEIFSRNMSESEFEKLKSTLMEIGCVEYDEWKAEKEEKGEIVKDFTVGEGMKNADIGTAVNFVSQLLGDYSDGAFSLSYMLDGGEKFGWVQTWLKNSRELENKKESNWYTNIEQIREEIEDLGDWTDPSQRDKFLKVISKIVALYFGYDHKILPESVLAAAADICSKKFPHNNELFEDGKLKPEFSDNELANFITLSTTTRGISFLGERTRINSLAREKFGIDVFHTQLTEEEIKSLTDSANTYLHENVDRSNIPYYKTAKQVLMDRKGMTEEEANKVINGQTFSGIERQVEASESMDNAIRAIARKFFANEFIAERELNDFVYYGEENRSINEIKRTIQIINDENADPELRENLRRILNVAILDTIFAVHDGWVRDNPNEFNDKEKRYQHMPSELIGWKKLRLDLIFVRNIYEALGIKINEEDLEKLYGIKMKDFFLNKGIKKTEDLVELISTGEDFYPPLREYGETLNDIKNPDFVLEEIIPSIEQMGAGKVEDIRREIILPQIMENPTTEEIALLTEDEQILVEQGIGKEVETLTAESDELQKKNDVAERIMNLSRRRRAVKEEITLEEQRKAKNIGNFGE